MNDHATAVSELACDLVAIDSRSFISNTEVADRIEAAITGFEIERLDYLDEAGVAKRALVAHRGRGGGGLALSGHMDTVPDTGWDENPWSARLDRAGVLHGLGSTDMKGPLAAIIVAARALPERIPATLLITTDEETTKEGARRVAQHSKLLRRIAPSAIVIAEPTALKPIRGHRSHVNITAVAGGVQAHSSSGKGQNANWNLLPFLIDMREVYEWLHAAPELQDPAYDPPFSDFNLVVDNHGVAVNVTVPKATARFKFRYSASIDPEPVLAAVRTSAARHGIEITESREGSPPELPVDHPFVRLCTEITGRSAGTAPYGTDASELQSVAPCVVLGPGDIAEAHTPTEKVRIADLAASVPIFMQMAEQVADGRPALFGLNR